MLDTLRRAAEMAGIMGWDILWALIFGFLISGVIQATVSHTEMARLLPDDRPRAILKATLLGAASSSCSYAAVAIGRSIFRRGGNFTAAMTFQFASTNLVIELGLILAILLGWRFTAATWGGGLIMIVLLVALMRLAITPRLTEQARTEAERGIAGKMEGHAAMDMAVTDGPFLARLFSADGFTATSHYFWMDWASLWFDIALGLLIAGAIAAWVPHEIWVRIFAARDPILAKIIGPLVGPLIAVLTFVCSVGNIPLAAVLWNGGASFGGVIAFIFGDLIVLPILDIYRRYYGLRAAITLALIFYAAMAGAGAIIELVFAVLHLTPTQRAANVLAEGITWNYTTWLNIVGMLISAALFWRFLRTGGPEMLRAMEKDPEAGHHCH